MKGAIVISLFISFCFSCTNTPENKAVENPNDCTEYACPMHPDKTSTTPAGCPECGMAMEKSMKKGSACDTLNNRP